MRVPIAIPDTDLARGAATLASRIEPPFLVRHSERTYQLGAKLLSVVNRAFDPELLYVACMLHDIALDTVYDDGETPFHYRGGGIAAKHIIDAERSENDATLIFDAIALHMELSTADDPRPEVAGVHLGAAADMIGLRLEQIPPELLEAVLSQSPRLGMKGAFIGAFGEEAARKPYSRAAELVRDFGFLDLIRASPFEE